jgi:hypothetical protein
MKSKALVAVLISILNGEEKSLIFCFVFYLTGERINLLLLSPMLELNKLTPKQMLTLFAVILFCSEFSITTARNLTIYLSKGNGLSFMNPGVDRIILTM